MKIKLTSYWNKIRESYWCFPLIALLSSIVLSLILVQLDKHFGNITHKYVGWLYEGRLEAVTSRLAAISGAMIAATGVVFSITIVAITVASQQFGPRLLRNFFRDRTTQFVLGTFISTAIYCMVTRYQINNTFTPYVSATFAGILAIFSAAVLIFFMHHISTSLHASNVIARVSRDFMKSINEFSSAVHKAKTTTQKASPEELEFPKDFDQKAGEVTSNHSGFIQNIDYPSLIRMAQKKELILKLNHRAGHFMMADATLAFVWPGEKNNQDISNTINNAIYLGNERTLNQDLEFAINQLVELATRTLSPGINDPFTAMGCINRLGEGLLRLTQIDFPKPYLCDSEQKLRIVIKPINYPGLVNASFNMIRQNGIKHPSVIIRLLEVIATIAKHVRRNEDRAALRNHAEMIMRGCQKELTEEFDLQRVNLQYETAVELLASN